MNRKLHEVASANGGQVLGEEYYPVDHADWAETVERINSSGAHVVFNTTVPPGCFPFLEALCTSGFAKRGGRIITTYWDENLTSAVPPEHIEGLYGCIDYYQSVNDPFSQELLVRYNARFPEGPHFSAGSGATGIYRGLKLWEAAVTEAGSLDQTAVVAALDHAKIADGPGGLAEMMPGQHHVRMNMYIARVLAGTLEVVESLGAIEPNEYVQQAA
jgi:branched-chain amino acid transport system substrate-binding protein